MVDKKTRKNRIEPYRGCLVYELIYASNKNTPTLVITYSMICWLVRDVNAKKHVICETHVTCSIPQTCYLWDTKTCHLWDVRACRLWDAKHVIQREHTVHELLRLWLHKTVVWVRKHRWLQLVQYWPRYIGVEIVHHCNLYDMHIHMARFRWFIKHPSLNIQHCTN